MKLTNAQKSLFIETAKQLRGHQKRIFMARTVSVLGYGGLEVVRKELGWGYNTIKKGLKELESGLQCYDFFTGRGRQRTEEHLPNFLNDLQVIANQYCQKDPKFQSRLYLHVSAASVRQELIKQKGYTDEELPSNETIRQRLRNLGYILQRKSLSKKASETTGANSTGSLNESRRRFC